MTDQPDTSMEGAVRRGWLKRQTAAFLTSVSVLAAGPAMAAPDVPTAPSTPQKQTELVASPQTREFLGKLGPFMVERAGTDYLMVLSTKDFSGKPNYSTPAIIPDYAFEETRKAIWQKNRDDKLNAEAAYGQVHIDPLLSPQLRAEIADLTYSERTAFYASVGSRGSVAARSQFGPASAIVYPMPNGKTLGVIDFDHDRVNNNLLGQRLPKHTGQYSDAAAWTLGHETGHIRDFAAGRFPMPTLNDHYRAMINPDSESAGPSYVGRISETGADRYGFAFYDEAKSTGIVQTSTSDMARMVLAGRMRQTLTGYYPGLSMQNHDTAHQIIGDLRGQDKVDTPLYTNRDLDFTTFVKQLDVAIGKTMLNDAGQVVHDSVEDAARLLSTSPGPQLDQRRFGAKIVIEDCRRSVFEQNRELLPAARMNDATGLIGAVTVDDSLRAQFGLCVRQSGVNLPLLRGLEAMQDAPNQPPTIERYRAVTADLLRTMPSTSPADPAPSPP